MTRSLSECFEKGDYVGKMVVHPDGRKMGIIKRYDGDAWLELSNGGYLNVGATSTDFYFVEDVKPKKQPVRTQQ